MQSQAENRAWGSDLRRKSSGLVNRRLAREITMDEYTASREKARADATECERRGSTLSDEIHRRSGIRLRMAPAAELANRAAVAETIAEPAA